MISCNPPINRPEQKKRLTHDAISVTNKRIKGKDKKDIKREKRKISAKRNAKC
jgi:hypothetical protein